MISLTSKRIRELARQPFHRKGGENFDVTYALSVLNARELVLLEDLANANPSKPVSLGHIGFVPNNLSTERL